MTEIDYKLLSIYIIFGFLTIVGYILMIIKYSKIGSYEIWSNKGKNIILDKKLFKKPFLKYVYTLMIFLSMIAGPYLIYYLTTVNKGSTDEILIYLGSVLFIVCSTFWAYMPFEYSKLILGTVAFGTILILAGISINDEDPKDPKKIVALLAASIIVTQTFFFDFILWTGWLKF